MSIDSSDILILQALAKPAIAGYWAVYWDANDPAEDGFYSDAAYNEMVPYGGIGHVIEPQLLDNVFAGVTFEINPDLRTETIPLNFNDIPVNGVRPISSKFKQFKSGIRCELFFYYADIGVTESKWSGQLQAPDIYGHKIVKTTATNGSKTRTRLLPGRMREISACNGGQNFGGQIFDIGSLRTNACFYNKHVSGETGVYRTGTTPFIDCDGSDASCNLRMNTTDAKHTLRFDVDASAVVTDQHSGWVAVSKGNASALSQPIPIIFGQKHVRGNQLLQWRREVNSSNPDRGFVSMIHDISEGPIQNALNFKVKEKIIEQEHTSLRFGNRIQIATPYAPDVANLSYTAHTSLTYGWTNPLNITADQLGMECDVIGYSDIYVPVTIEAGHGLIGKYYSDKTPTIESARKVDANINFPLTNLPPVQGNLQQVGWLTVWTGSITFPATETVTLSTSLNDDYVKVRVNGSTIFEVTTVLGSGTFAATASVAYPIEITFKNIGNIANPSSFNPWGLILKWASASIGAATVIPTSAFTHGADLGFQRQWTDDRVWCLREAYGNQRWGLGYPLSRFNFNNWKEVSAERRSTVQFQFTRPDTEVETHAGIATTFNVILEGRPIAEQIVDICRSGGISVPFEHEGSFEVRSFRAATAPELAAAKVFTDTGDNMNIYWDGSQPAIDLFQTPDNLVTNEIQMTFEEAANSDAGRPITVDNPDQRLLAGRALGGNNLEAVLKVYSALGVRELQEAVRLAYRLLKFGEFDEGGTDNNLRATFTVPYVFSLGIVRYDIIKIVSNLLDDFEIGLGATAEDPQYFRVLSLRKVDAGMVQVIAQAYNKTAYEAFEVLTVIVPPTTPPDPAPPTPPDPTPGPCIGEIDSVSYDPATGTLEIVPIPC